MIGIFITLLIVVNAQNTNCIINKSTYTVTCKGVLKNQNESVWDNPW